jgi:phosphoribosylanthranilate isomerase
MTLVKICGLTREQDVDQAVEAGADLVGFVCVADSPRGVTLDRAAELARRVPAGVRTVAVFAGPEPDGPTAVFDLVQVYGPSARTSGVILGFRGAPPDELPEGVPVLLDLDRESRPGPDTLRGHWSRAAAVRAPVLLAGSLDPGNVAEAVAAAHPWGVDTARGVEAAPGVKDHALVTRFVSNAKEAA